MKEKIRIRVKLRSYDVAVLDNAVLSIVESAVSTGAKVIGPVPLPVKRTVYAVNRSPHVYKSSVEHFDLVVHSRLVDIVDPTSKTIDVLQHLEMPAGVHVKIKS